jgi:O-antigen/teichoic acid export membrane protein
MSQPALKHKAITGVIWSAIEKFSVQGIQFIIGIVLARLLMPEDFGLIGMLAIFMAISQLFVDSGFSKALIQKQDRTETDYSTVFYFNLGISAFFYVLLFIFAPLIADFYDAPKLIPLTRVFGLTVIINAFTTVQTTILNIEIDFKRLAKLNFLSVIFSGATGLIMAYTGFGVWALVGQSIIQAVVYNIIVWYGSKWKPSIVFSTDSFKILFKFGSKLLLAGTIATVITNAYSILIGKFFSSKDVGYYTRSMQYTDLLSGAVTSVLQRVTFPILASVQNDRERMLRIYRQILRSTAFFIFPVTTLFALLSEPFVRVFLTEKWIATVPLLQWLCFARLITPISSLNMNILNAMGRSDLFLKIDLFKVPMVLIAMVIAIPYGINVIVVANFITSFLAFFFNTYYPGKLYGYGALAQIKDMSKIIISTGIMAITVLIMTSLISNSIIQIVAGGASGVCVYIACLYLLKSDSLHELFFMFRENMEERKGKDVRR